MATIALRPITVHRHISQDHTPSDVGIEAAAQTFVKGDIIVNSSGKVAIGAADPALGSIVGVAEHAASGVTDASLRYVPATNDVEFEANLLGTLALTDVYTRYGIAVSGGFFVIDQSDTTNDRVVVTGLVNAVDDVNGRVRFRFLPNASVFTATAV
jgi:hypothetical protein